MANRYLLTTLIILGNIFGGVAQVDKKYLEGAVPLVDGKVFFTRDLKLNPNVSEAKLFELAEKWANKEFSRDAEENKNTTRNVLLSNSEDGYIACQGDDELVFKSSLLSLDRTRMLYQLIIRVEPGKYILQFRNIKYEYQDSKELIVAEKQITDKYALNKDGTKLNRYYDKFRIFTIDRVDELQESLKTHINEHLSPIQPAPSPSIQAIGSPAVTVVQPMKTEEDAQIKEVTPIVSVAVNAMAGYKKMPVDQLSESIMNMFKDNWALVSLGDVNNTEVTPAAWSGMGNFGGKPVSMVLVDSGNNKNETYTISFYTQIHKSEMEKIENKQNGNLTPIATSSGAIAYSEAWMIIECKKVLEQPVTEAMVEGIQSKGWNKASFDKLFMGEIINIWAR